MPKLLRQIHYLLNRRRLERELEDEMAAHREMMTADRQNSFGNMLRVREEARDVWGWQWLEDVQQDLRQSARGFIRDRRIGVSAVLAIALAVGAATAVFSVVDRSLFRALPYTDGERLVTVGLVLPSWGPQGVMFAGAYRDWQGAQEALDLTSWSGVSGCDLGGDSPQRLHCAKAESTFLPTLGVQPIIGRIFNSDEDRPGAEPVALLSSEMWRNQYGSDPGVLHKSIVLDGQLTRIIGVLPPQFETPNLEPADLLIPQKLRRERARNIEIRLLGRLRPGYTVEGATAALDSLFQAFRRDFGARVGDNFARTMRLRITRLRDQQVQQYRVALWTLLGAVTAFILIACANVGNLLLARAAARRQEIAMRTALGASRARLVRQLLTESGLLAVVGGTAGCLLAWGLLRVAVTLAPDGVLRLRQSSLDARVLAFALILSLGTALLFGLGPSFHQLRTEMLGGARVVRQRRNWFGQTLIIGQIALSLVLLTGAALLLLSFWRLRNAPLGMERERVVTASFVLPEYRYADDARQLQFLKALEERLKDLPGTIAAAIADSLPPGDETRRSPIANQARTEIIGSVRWRYVTPGYFGALGIPIRMGRSFTEEDRFPGEVAIVVNESLARSQYEKANPVGTRTGRGWPRVVVGVAGDVRNNGVSSVPDPEFYVIRRFARDGVPGDSDPAWWRRASAVVRSTLSEAATAAALQSVLHDLDPALPVQIRSMHSHVDRWIVRPRFQTVLLALFAVTGLLLAGIGLYGLISFLVADRTREIGVRMALGASPGSVISMVASDAARWTCAGAVIGLAASAGLVRVLQSLLFEVDALDVRAFIGAAVSLSTVALVAAWLPARRASLIQPVIALRQE